MKIKYTLLIVFSVLFVNTIFSQTVNSISITEIDAEYVEISIHTSAFSNYITIELNYGQVNRTLDSQDSEIKDENGKPLKFNSMIDALNFMCKNGYEYVDSYTISDENTPHYLLRKKD